VRRWFCQPPGPQTGRHEPTGCFDGVPERGRDVRLAHNRRKICGLIFLAETMNLSITGGKGTLKDFFNGFGQNRRILLPEKDSYAPFLKQVLHEHRCI